MKNDPVWHVLIQSGNGHTSVLKGLTHDAAIKCARSAAPDSNPWPRLQIAAIHEAIGTKPHSATYVSTGPIKKPDKAEIIGPYDYEMTIEELWPKPSDFEDRVTELAGRYKKHE